MSQSPLPTAVRYPYGTKCHYPGIDVLRVLAAAFIFVQHWASVTDHDHLSLFAGTRIGRLGTALLFGLSGYLSATTTRKPETWLGRRMWRIYSPFWVVLAVTFTATLVTRRKSFDWLQVMCQAAGVGFFTHSWQLVGVSTWFVSLLVFLTVLVYLAQRLGHLVVLGPAVVAVAVGSHLVNPYIAEYYGFAMAFLIGYGMAPVVGAAHYWLLPLLGLGVIAGFGLPGYRYTLAATLLVALATRPGWPTWQTAARFAPCAYEWFLIHGLCLHAVYLFAKPPWLVFVIAGPLSVTAAVLFRAVLDATGRGFARSGAGVRVSRTVPPIG